jgi:hypothetical protein
VFEFLIARSLRIMGVSGNNIKRWDVVGSDDKAAAAAAAAAAAMDLVEIDDEPVGASDNRILKIWLEYGMEDEYVLEIQSELEMPSNPSVAVPRLQPIGINREKGFVGVEARTNVEINESHLRGYARIGTSELPQELLSKSPNPILLAYKFQQGSDSLLKLSIKKHKDVCQLLVPVPCCNAMHHILM